jgi:hypothetical protein
MNKIYQHQDRKDREKQILSYFSNIKEKQSRPTKKSKKRVRLDTSSLPKKQNKIPNSSQKKSKKK